MAKRRTYSEGYKNGARDVFEEIVTLYPDIDISELAVISEAFGISEEQLEEFAEISEEEEGA